MVVSTEARYRGKPLGHRIHVTGNSCSGKSTLANQLAAALKIPRVEMDALNWLPGWISLADTNPVELEHLLAEATNGDAWVVSGSYMGFSLKVFWQRVETVVWLDLPARLLVWRVVTRTWRRRRSKDLLWGTNHEQFWPLFKAWNRGDSLIWWIVTQQRRKRQRMNALMSDPSWQHITFIRLGSTAEIDAFGRALGLDPSLNHGIDYE